MDHKKTYEIKPGAIGAMTIVSVSRQPPYEVCKNVAAKLVDPKAKLTKAGAKEVRRICAKGKVAAPKEAMRLSGALSLNRSSTLLGSMTPITVGKTENEAVEQVLLGKFGGDEAKMKEHGRIYWEAQEEALGKVPAVAGVAGGAADDGTVSDVSSLGAGSTGGGPSPGVAMTGELDDAEFKEFMKFHEMKKRVNGGTSDLAVDFTEYMGAQKRKAVTPASAAAAKRTRRQLNSNT